MRSVKTFLSFRAHAKNICCHKHQLKWVQTLLYTTCRYFFSWEICTSDGFSMQSCKHSNLAHFLNISHMKLYIFGGQIVLSFTATQSLYLLQKSLRALSWLWNPCPAMALGSMSSCAPLRLPEPDETQYLSNVVESQPELYQSKLKTVLYVFTAHSCTKVPLTVAMTKTSWCHGLCVALDSSWKTLWCFQ